MSEAQKMRGALETIKVALLLDDPHNHYDMVCDALASAQQSAEPVAFSYSPDGGSLWLDWSSDWDLHETVKEKGFRIEYAHKTPPAAPVVPNGWAMTRTDNGEIVITHNGIGGVVVERDPKHAREIPEAILWALADALLATPSPAPEQRSPMDRHADRMEAGIEAMLDIEQRKKVELTDDMVVHGAEVLHDSLRAAGCDHDFDHDLEGTSRQQEIVEDVFNAMMRVHEANQSGGEG